MREELDEIRRRLDALESRMDSEAGLRAMMDRDQAALVTRFDAQDNLLRALAITQSEHTRRLTRLEDGVQRLEVGQQRLEEGQQRLEGRQQQLEGAVGRVETGIQAIVTMLGEAR